MPITLDTYVDYVFYRVGQGAPEEQASIWRTAIEASLNAALQRLGDRVALDSDPTTRARLQKVFSVTLTAGDGALNAAMVTSVLPAAYLTLNGTSYPLLFVPFYQDLLNLPPLNEFYFWTVHEGKIKVRDYAGVAPAATALSVFSSYIPTVSEVPDEFIDDVIDIGVELALESKLGQAAKKEAENI